MTDQKVYTAIGLMSGTSLDGVDAALLETDGRGYVKPLGFVNLPYAPRVRDEIRAVFGVKNRRRVSQAGLTVNCLTACAWCRAPRAGANRPCWP